MTTSQVDSSRITDPHYAAARILLDLTLTDDQTELTAALNVLTALQELPDTTAGREAIDRTLDSYTGDDPDEDRIPLTIALTQQLGWTLRTDRWPLAAGHTPTR